MKLFFKIKCKLYHLYRFFFVISLFLLSFYAFQNVSAYSSEPTQQFIVNLDNEKITYLTTHFNLSDWLDPIYEIIEQEKNDFPYYQILLDYNTTDSYFIYFTLFSELPQIYYYAVPGSNAYRTQWVYNRLYNYSGTWKQCLNVGNNYPKNYCNTNTYIKSGSDVYSSFFTPQQSGDYYYINSDFIIYDQNFDISFTYRPSDSSDYTKANFLLGGNYYSYGESFPTYLNYQNPVPKLTLGQLIPFTNSNGNVYKYESSYSYSLFSPSLYRYEYKTPDSDNWLTLDSQSGNFNYFTNGSYYFRIVDILNDKLLDIQTVNITGITDDSPFIIYNLESPNSCFAYIDNEFHQICYILYMQPSITSGGNYYFQYNFNNTVWNELYTFRSFQLSNNETVNLRVITQDTGQVVWTANINVRNLYEIDSSLGIFATFNDVFWTNSDGRKYTFLSSDIYIYNLPLRYLNNVYYSFDSKDWKLLKLENVQSSTFYQGTTDTYSMSDVKYIYLKVLDDSGNLVYSTVHEIEYFTYQSNSINDWLSNFNDTLSGSFSDFLTFPFRLFAALESSANSCTPLSFTIPRLNAVITLPCMTDIYTRYFGDYFVIYQVLVVGLLSYYIGLNIVSTVKNLATPQNDRIEVIDL